MEVSLSVSNVAQHYQVLPFSRVEEGDDVVIGRAESGTFLAVSPDIVQILDWLSEGKSLSRMTLLYEERYGDPDGLEDLVDLLVGRGFLQPSPDAAVTAVKTPESPSRPSNLLDLAAWAYRPVGLSVQLTLLASAVWVLVEDPGLAPGIRAIFFEEHVTLTSLLVILLSLATLALHEGAHMAAAWARGVRSQLGVGHRLWMLVAETDLSGLWSLPRRKRFLPILAGPLADLVTCALVVMTLWAESDGWFSIPSLFGTVLRATLVIGVLRLLWQGLLFLRTDFYYALAHLFRCRDLMGDTERYLRSRWDTVLGRSRRSPLAELPKRERRVVRAYSVLWLLGRTLALGFLVVVQIPLIVHYVSLFLTTLAGGVGQELYAFVDTLIMASFVLLSNGLGFVLWIRSLIHPRRRNDNLPAGSTA